MVSAATKRRIQLLAVTPSRQRKLQVAAMLAGTVLLISGCATLSPGEREAKRETRRMLVTAYDAGPKSTGWEYRFLDFFFTPVYAYGPNKGKVKEVGVTSSGKKAKKGTIAADVRLFLTEHECTCRAMAGEKCRTRARPSGGTTSMSSSPKKKTPSPGAENISM
jgi:hypothetical protein